MLSTVVSLAVLPFTWCLCVPTEPVRMFPDVNPKRVISPASSSVTVRVAVLLEPDAVFPERAALTAVAPEYSSTMKLDWRAVVHVAVYDVTPAGTGY